jgi:hypothetical protein
MSESPRSMLGSTKTDLEEVSSKLGSQLGGQLGSRLTPKLTRSTSRSRKVSAVSSGYVGPVAGAEVGDSAAMQTTLAAALCMGLDGAKWTEEKFETSKEVLTAILINIVRKEQGGVSPLDFNGKQIVIMDGASEHKIMKTFNIAIEFHSRESFLKDWKKFKGNSEFVLGKGDNLLLLKSVEGNILCCLNSTDDVCPTFTVGNVDGGFFQIRLRAVFDGKSQAGAKVLPEMNHDRSY